MKFVMFHVVMGKKSEVLGNIADWSASGNARD